MYIQEPYIDLKKNIYTIQEFSKKYYMQVKFNIFHKGQPLFSPAYHL